MKKDIHPKVYPVVFVDTQAGAQFVTTSTMTSEETRDIDGVPYFVIPIEISSASHPFYTGKQVFVDTARRVEKFQEKVERAKKVGSVRKTKRIKRAAKTAARAPKAEEAKRRKAIKTEKKVK